MHGVISLIHHFTRHHHKSEHRDNRPPRDPVVFDPNPVFEMPKVALIERNGEYYEYDYDAVISDPCYVHTGMYVLLGTERHMFRFVPLPE